MFDYDAVIVGAGPAGLTAGIYLARARYRVLLVEKELLGGQLMNIEWIENYPGFADGVAGPQLGSQMLDQAMKCGVELEMTEVTGVDTFSNCQLVNCADGKGFTTGTVVVAGGCRPKSLGVPGEEQFRGSGIIHCALCDGGQFADRVVVVCGGGDAGVTEALYLTKLASRVVLIEALPSCTAAAVLQERAAANPKLEVRCGQRVERIIGDTRVKAIEVVNQATGDRETIETDGVLVHVGIVPNSGYLEGIVPLDRQGQVVVNGNFQTERPSILAAGDIRSGSVQQVAAAVGDGAAAAIAAQRLLQTMKG